VERSSCQRHSPRSAGTCLPFRRPTSTNDRWIPAKANETRLRELEDFLGGGWWKPIWRSDAANRVEQIFERYLQQIRTTGSGWRTLAVPVADRWDGPPAYFLVLFTQNKQGLWYFANATSYGADALHDFTFRNDPQPKLLMPEDAENWVGQIERNIQRLIDRYGSFRPIDYTTEMYGKTLGRAREKHVREALNNLYQQGRTSSNPRGVQDLHSMQVSAHRK
jgi:hypothetical protein